MIAGLRRFLVREVHPHGENVVKERLGQVEQRIMPPGERRIEVHQRLVFSSKEDVAVVGVAMPDDRRACLSGLQQYS